MKKRRKPRFIRLRFRRNDPAHNLQAAVQHWVEANGGRLVMVGGIQVQHWPQDRPGVFKVAVGCTGRPPAPKVTSKPEG